MLGFAKLTHVQDSFDAREVKLSGCHERYYGALRFGQCISHQNANVILLRARNNPKIYMDPQKTPKEPKQS